MQPSEPDTPGQPGKSTGPVTPEKTGQPERPGPQPIKWRRALVGLLVALALLLILGPMMATLQTSFYQRYRQLRGPVENWSRSTHAKMSCVSCHLEPGAENLLLFAVKSVPTFYGQLLQRPEGGRLFATPSRYACRRCHTTWRTVSPSGDLLIPHRAHVELLKLNCTQCHQNLVHSPNPKGFNRPKMTGCLEKCHDGRKAKNGCTDCHTEKAVPQNHTTGNWLDVHSQKTEEINCGKCHGWAPKLCQACHTQRPRTHVGNWKKLHKNRANVRGKGCLVCHGGRKFCLRCHDDGLFDKALFRGINGK